MKLRRRTNAEIADALHISLNTVKHHVTSIYKKLEKTRKDLLRLQHPRRCGQGPKMAPFGRCALRLREREYRRSAARDSGRQGYGTRCFWCRCEARLYLARGNGCCACTIKGTSAANTITGTSDADVICALGGNDTVYGAGGKDVIKGGSGNDTLKGQGANDQLIGNGGSDNLFGGSGDDKVNSKDSVSGNDSLDRGTHVGGDTKITDADEKSIVGFP